MKILNYIQIVFIIILISLIIFVMIKNKKSEEYTLTVNTTSTPKYALSDGIDINLNPNNFYLLTDSKNLLPTDQNSLKNFVNQVIKINQNDIQNIQTRYIFTIYYFSPSTNNFIYLYSDNNGNLIFKMNPTDVQTNNNYYWTFIEQSRDSLIPPFLTGKIQHLSTGKFIPSMPPTLQRIISTLVDDISQAGNYKSQIFNLTKSSNQLTGSVQDISSSLYLYIYPQSSAPNYKVAGNIKAYNLTTSLITYKF